MDTPSSSFCLDYRVIARKYTYSLSWNKKEAPDLKKYSNLTHVYFNDEFNAKIDHFPDTLFTLVFGKNYRHTIESWPTKLKELVIGENQPIYIWPNKLEILGIKGGYYVPMIIPDTVRVLDIYDYNDQTQINHLPQRIQEINLYHGDYGKSENAKLKQQMYIDHYYLNIFE